MDVYLKEKNNTKSLFRFPSLPDGDVQVDKNMEYQDYDILKKGTYSFPSGKKPTTVKWDGYFWGKRHKSKAYNRKWQKPSVCIKKLSKWLNDGTVLILTISGAAIRLNVTIKSFEYKRLPGGDVSYSITLTQYRELKIQTTKEAGIKKSTSKSKSKTKTSQKKKKKTRSSKKKGQKKTYTVVSGDCLWNIAKKKCGSGTKWKTLYDANKSVIEATARKYGRKNSDNGHWIYPGTILTLP